ncbi:hypothetical protein D1872_277270 [compost metagenome]
MLAFISGITQQREGTVGGTHHVNNLDAFCSLRTGPPEVRYLDRCGARSAACDDQAISCRAVVSKLSPDFDTAAHRCVITGDGECAEAATVTWSDDATVSSDTDLTDTGQACTGLHIDSAAEDAIHLQRSGTYCRVAGKGRAIASQY